ncbi:MAG: hypothetical protein KC925_04030, partial [Candidatus Doudnabacteria bacterium]|nr:hypothetical protein [Candidatus Doudnabacteria bacterium]
MSAFEHEHDVLDWYTNQERRLTNDFISTIEWSEVSKHELDERFLPVLVYMRDIEKFTEIYYEELCRTSTGRDPIIRSFMDKWSTEEDTHAVLINRFLQEAGYPTTEQWYDEVRARIPRRKHV